MDELTYILGAGASYQSFPIVKTFTDRFSHFINSNLSYTASESIEPSVKEFYKTSRSLIKVLHSHQSFDTYFKKLYHNGLNNQILESKRILNIYFTWEHIAPIENKPEKDIFWKQSVIDKRYDALIAGLLKPLPDKTETFTKVNFITWNYDLNLLCSLKDYFDSNSSLQDFIKKIQVKQNLWQINNQVTVLNMNGFFYSTLFGNKKTISGDIYDHQFLSKILNKELLDTQVTLDAQSIKFAWEQENQTVIKVAKEAIEKSENIVVIGYTFPLYNRLIDLNYLDKSILTSKTIILQDPDAISIRTTFLEMFDSPGINILNSYLNVKTKTDCNYFYIPSNIFTEKDKPKNLSMYFH